jgi:hypothetical protein
LAPVSAAERRRAPNREKVWRDQEGRPLYFEIVGEIGDIEVIAKGPSVRE